MEEQSQVPGGDASQSVGDGEKTEGAVEQPPERKSSKDTVAYETYHRTVSQKKKLEEENERLKREASERAEKDLKENERWQELAQLREKEAAEAKAKAEAIETSLLEGKKLSSVLDALPSGVDKKYWNLIDTSGVVLNPETGDPEAASVQEVAKRIQEDYPEILQKASAPGQPAAAPRLDLV